jgi:hypothetical protein
MGQNVHGYDAKDIGYKNKDRQQKKKHINWTP